MVSALVPPTLTDYLNLIIQAPCYMMNNIVSTVLIVVIVSLLLHPTGDQYTPDGQFVFRLSGGRSLVSICHPDEIHNSCLIWSESKMDKHRKHLSITILDTCKTHSHLLWTLTSHFHSPTHFLIILEAICWCPDAITAFLCPCGVRSRFTCFLA